MAGAEAEAQTPELVPYVICRAGTAMHFPCQRNRLLAKGFICAAESLSQRCRHPILFIGYLFQKLAGCLDIAPLEVDAAEVPFGDNAVFIEVHGPGDDAAQLLAIHPEFIDQGRDFRHLFIAHHNILVQTSGVIMPEFSREDTVWAVFEEWDFAGIGATRAPDRPDVVLHLVGMQIALFSDFVVAQMTVP